MRCACLSSYMHIYPDRSGYKLYVAIILATGSCVLKYDPPRSTVDNSVSNKRYVLIRFSLHACVLFKYMCIYGYSVLHILFVYMSVFQFLDMFQALVFGPKIRS